MRWIAYLFLFVIPKCGSESPLPLNEYQYAVCNKALECNLILEANEKCVVCVDRHLSKHPELSAKTLANTAKGQSCQAVNAYASSAGILQCVNGD